MTVLWIALGIYFVGVSLVLYMRPGIMFRDDGKSWKEFGLSSKSGYTMFPFWLFAVLWALLSYTIATLGAILLASLALRSTNNNSSLPYSAQYSSPYPVQQPTFPSDIQPISSQRPMPQPGYYVLESQPVGNPKYVFFGHQPPKYM